MCLHKSLERSIYVDGTAGLISGSANAITGRTGNTWRVWSKPTVGWIHSNQIRMWIFKRSSNGKSFDPKMTIQMTLTFTKNKVQQELMGTLLFQGFLQMKNIARIKVLTWMWHSPICSRDAPHKTANVNLIAALEQDFGIHPPCEHKCTKCCAVLPKVVIF